jgi:hypothetical protein
MKTGAAYHTFGRGKSVANEKTYPYLVEIPVSTARLDDGRTISRYGENYYRWCFADLMTALAFVEQFGGAFPES